MMRRQCRAKINLYLSILGKRPDGFHELDTLFQEIDLADQLSWEPKEGPFKLQVNGADVGHVNDNLVTRAIHLFEQATELSGGGTWTLDKNIPAGGGLGGGSSDAAAALAMLNEYHGEPLPEFALVQLAASLGSDIPFFLNGGCQRGLGKGADLTPVTTPQVPKRGLLILPPISLSTVAVYRAYIHEGGGGPQPEIGYNDLLEAALAISQPLSDLWWELQPHFSKDGIFFMTGSGSTLVWLSDNPYPGPKRQALIDKSGSKVAPFKFVE